MRIAIDARWIFPEISGIGQYTSELIRHLALQDTENEYVLIFSDATVLSRILGTWGNELPDRFVAELTPHGVFSPWSQVRMPGQLKKWGIDLYHSPNYMIPFCAFPRSRKGKIKCVTTVHDVIPLLFPGHAPKSRKSKLFPLFVRTMREVGIRSNAIITVSRTSARDIIEHLRIPVESADRVHAIYNGVSDSFRPAKRESGETKEPKTILYVGRSDPYKNLVILIKAFANVRESLSSPIELQIIGPPDARYPEALDLAEERGLGDAVKWTGYLSDEKLVRAYQRADILVHPSRYEGFGLQVLEAMACGVPVISSNAGALKEVVGDAGITVGPDDLDGYMLNIKKVLGDPELARALSEKGIQRAKEFSWARTARETLGVYRGLAKDRT